MSTAISHNSLYPNLWFRWGHGAFYRNLVEYYGTPVELYGNSVEYYGTSVEVY
jgi:hypothetical protein